MKSILLVFFILTIIAFVKQLKYPERELFSFDKDRCNSLRGVMSLMIVCCHTSYSSSDMRGWGAPVVAMFMSGYGLMNSFVRAGFKYLEGFFHNRVGKILLPLLLVTTIHIISMAIFYGCDLSSFLSDIVNAKAPIGATWYLYVSLYFYAAFYLSAYIGYSFNFKVIFISMFLLSALFVIIILLIGDKWGYWAVPSFVMLAGMTYNYYEDNLQTIITKKPLIFIPLIPILLLCCYGSMRFIPYSYFLIYALMPVSLVWLVYFLGFKENRVVMWLGSLSYEIYLIHDSVISHLLPLKLNHYLYVLLVFLITIPLAIVLNKINKDILYKL